MKRTLITAGVLLIVAAAPLHAYVSPGSMKIVKPQGQTLPTTGDATTIDVESPEFGLIDRKEVKGKEHERGASNPVPEPGTMAITSIGLLAAAALRKKRSR